MSRPRPSGRVQLLAVIGKELRQTLRDRRMLFMLVFAPLVQTVVFGYAVDFSFDLIPTAVVDRDGTSESRRDVRRLLADGTLHRSADLPDAPAAQTSIAQGEAALALILPEGLGRDRLAGRSVDVQVLLDGTDPNRAAVAAAAVARYYALLGAELVQAQLQARGMTPPPQVALEPRILFNPALQTAPFMLPGVMCLLLLITTTIVTAMGLSREREMGTLEQVLVTPVRPLHLLLGKMAPFAAIGLVDVLLVLTAGVWIFDVPARGNLLVLAVGVSLYILCTLAIGLLISTLSRTQQQSFLAGFLFVMPAILLSGVMTPILSMPAWLQVITYVNPVRYAVEVLRANLLKGAGFVDLWPQLAILALMGTALLAVAADRFRKRIE